MIQPLLLYREELLESGLTFDQVIAASELIHGAFGESFWDELDRKFKESYKDSVWKHFGVHKIYRWLSGPVMDTWNPMSVLKLWLKQKD